ncbi:hypothetical protein [Streptomyces sp. M41(2017)]|uniref:hypothetical protein n=1 Tax=unclassified Streptomyces TaxID=2593676 RepID=UPI0009BF12E7|nr:hypothetical protein [Streptomyces sp. M41(2017)]OQQ14877.1 hypothetical protein B0675_32865 [Streptomyces sp. M41(2017)]
MGTAERSGTLEARVAPREAAQQAPQAPDRDIPAVGRDPRDRPRAVTEERDRAGARRSARDSRGRADEKGTVTDAYAYEEDEVRAYYRPLWIEEPARKRRLPDPVRTSAVRAVVIISVTLTQAVVAFLCTVTGSWLAFPMVLSSVASTVVATWAALDVWVTRQVWNQRHGVVSEPSSTARALRRERRKARRHARVSARTQERIRRRGAAGQLSHS